MKAVRLIEVGQPLEEREIPVPEPGDRDVLVRVKAAGICHSDAHYRAGVSPAGPLPLTPGHEVSGIVERAGAAVTSVTAGDRVCVHYLAACGDCPACVSGHEQFCAAGRMIGKHRDGGYAEFMVMPARSVVPLPEEISFAEGAVLMCSSSTVLHALRKARLRGGESVAIFGAGGLGMSAVQLARAFGALDVFAVDIRPEALEFARRLGAVPVDASRLDPVAEIGRLTGGRGVDVALELVGLPSTVHQALRCLAVLGRAAMVGLCNRPVEVNPYADVLGKEAEIIGSSDHLLSELPALLELARRRVLDLSGIVTRTLPLEAAPINAALDDLDAFRGGDVRRVIQP